MAHGDLILIGPPGSGKGTQARLLVSRPGWVHLATGDLFRDHQRRGTPLGRLAASHMAKGEYVPDEVTVGIVRERLGELAPTDRVVFDGFPRTVAQAEELEGLLRERDRAVGRVLLIEVPREELVRRLTARGEGRADDSPEVILRRLDVYEERTRPVVRHYEAKGLVCHVEGVGDVAAVAERIRTAIGS